MNDPAGITMLKIIKEYLGRMAERIKCRNILLQGICSILLLFITITGGAMTLKEIKEITNGKGVFSVVVTNNGKHNKLFTISVHVVNPPPGCEVLGSRFLRSLSIKSGNTMTIELPVPLIGPQGWKWNNGDNIDPYDNVDNLLPLPEDCEVVVRVESTAWSRFDYPPQYQRSFKADYLRGTRFIELPQEVPFAVNFDPTPSIGPTPQWIKDLVSDMFPDLPSPPSFK